MTGTIIAVITGLAFVGMALYLVVQSTRIQYPNGVRYDFPMGALQVRLVYDVPPEDRTRHALVATTKRALRMALAAGPTNAFIKQPTGQLVVHVTAKVYRGLHGVQTYARAKIGPRRVPMLVIEDSTDNRRTASLIIHEMGHLLTIELTRAPDVEHVLDTVWQPVGGAESFEARAMAHYDGA